MEILKSNNYLIDTNILVYAVGNDKEISQKSKDLISKLIQEKYKLFLSTQNILEYRRVVTHSKFPNPLPEKELTKSTDFWLSRFKLIYPDNTAWIEYRKLEKKLKPKGNVVFDIWLVSTMIANGVDTILTLNDKHFRKIKEIKTLNPFT